MSKEEVELGFFENVPYEEYEKWKGLRGSNLWTMIEKTPAHYKYQVENPSDYVATELNIGHATHTAVLEPELFEGLYEVLPARYINAKGEDKPFNMNANICKEMKADILERGVIPLKRSEYDLCRFLRDSVWRNPTAVTLLKAGKKELSMRWLDKTTGRLMKGRMDLWIESGGIVADLKTARNASVRIFGADSYRLGYHFKMAMYYAGAATLSKVEMGNPVLIAVEKEPPYLTHCFEVERDERICGEAQLSTVMEKVVECEKSGEWPGYSQGLTPLMLPAYAGQEIDSTHEQ